MAPKRSTETEKEVADSPSDAKIFREMENEVVDDNECSDAVASASDAWWIELPKHLKTEILGWLPVKDVYKNRSVCQHWNALLSSENFMDLTWAEAAINKQPWLVLCVEVGHLLWPYGVTNMPCMAFCFYTRSWKTCFSLSFLNRQHSTTVIGKTSAAGVILVDWIGPGAYGNITRGLCNPYTKTIIELPSMSTINMVMNKCVALNDNNEYMVVALGLSWQDGVQSTCVETYDRSQGRWNVAGFLPANLKYCKGMFFYNGSVYCLGVQRQRQTELGIAGFNLPSNGNGNGTELPMVFAPLPEPHQPNQKFPKLLNCGSRILLAPIRFVRGEIVIWEFENNRVDVLASSNSTSTSTSTSSSSWEWKWKEIARMPPNMSTFTWFDCVGVGDYVCFLKFDISSSPGKKEINAIAYNLNESCWISLPPCSLPDNWRKIKSEFFFQPTAHMMDVQ